jgi:hypothetical protein
VIIRFPCPVCETPGRLDVPTSGLAPSRWICPHCQHPVEAGPVLDPTLPACALCGNGELYTRKDFPHALGMAILVGACLASTITYWMYDKTLTWAILLGSAAFDGLLYLWVPDVIVCYRCQAHHSGVPVGPEHRPFELTIHERYRQERLRKEQLTSPTRERGDPTSPTRERGDPTSPTRERGDLR